jgi:hypothetical protein
MGNLGGCVGERLGKFGFDGKLLKYLKIRVNE